MDCVINDTVTALVTDFQALYLVNAGLPYHDLNAVRCAAEKIYPQLQTLLRALGSDLVSPHEATMNEDDERKNMTNDEANEIVAKLLALLTKDNPYDGKWPLDDKRKAEMASYVIRSSNDGFKWTRKKIKRLCTGKIAFGEYDGYDGFEELYADCFEIANG